MDVLSLQSSLQAAGATTPVVGRSTTASTNLDNLDFQKTLSALLNSAGLSGTSGSDSSSSASLLGGGSSDMMMPMMFAMMEQLLMKQMELLQSGKLSPTGTTSAPAAASTTADTPAAATAQTTELKQPLILQTNQKLRELNNQASAASAAQAASVQPVTDPSAPIATSGSAVPHGEPAQGPLTQGYTASHNGLDIGIVIGTPVHSSMEGKVTYAGWSPIGYGNLVIVQNGDYQTYYAHLSKIPVTVGQTIQAGSVIGLSGSTGNSTGPHLHYEVRYKGKNVNPTNYLTNKAA